MDYSELIKRDFEARAKDELDARAILETAAAENRDVTAEEEERFDKLVASSDARKARIAKMEKLQADAKAAEEASRDLPERTDEPVLDEEPKRGQISQLIEMISVHKATNTVQTREFAMPQGEEVRAIADFSTGTSLYVSDFLGRLIIYMRATSPLIGLASVVSGDGRPLIVPNLTADPSIVAPGEGTAITENSGTLGTVTATPVAYKALSYISWEASQDEQVGLLQAIAGSQGRALGIFAGTAMTATVVTGAGNGGTAVGTPFFTAPDLVSLFYSVPPAARANGSWLMANGAIAKTRKFTDTNGQFLWGMPLSLGQPDTLLGRPVYEDPGLATPASATKSVLFGDFSVVFIKQAALRVAVSTEARFSTDEIAIKSVYRAGAAVADSGAIKYLVSANT